MSARRMPTWFYERAYMRAVRSPREQGVALVFPYPLWRLRCTERRIVRLGGRYAHRSPSTEENPNP